MCNLISIIIPHFNSYCKLQKLIKSIGALDRKQVIIVDDRSDNGDYKKILDKYKETDIEIYRNEKGKKGAGTCRNIGLKYVKSKWITFIDSDDYFTIGAFDIIENEINSVSRDIDIIYCVPTSIDSSTNKLSDRHLKSEKLINNYINTPNKTTEYKLRYTYNSPVSFLIRNSLIKKFNLRFDETIVANDTIFSALIGKYAHKIKGSSNTFYCITKSVVSLTSVKDPIKYKIRLDVFIRYYNMFSKEERKLLSISPIPLIIAGFNYGQNNIFKTIFYLKKHDISIFSNLEINTAKIKRFFNLVKHF